MEIPFLDQDKKSKEEESRWFRYCSSKDIPMVKTQKRTSLGDVDWDYITMNPADEEFLSTQEEFIKTELKELLKYYAIEKTEENIDSYTGIVRNLPIKGHLEKYSFRKFGA